MMKATINNIFAVVAFCLSQGAGAATIDLEAVSDSWIAGGIPAFAKQQVVQIDSLEEGRWDFYLDDGEVLNHPLSGENISFENDILVVDAYPFEHLKTRIVLSGWYSDRSGTKLLFGHLYMYQRVGPDEKFELFNGVPVSFAPLKQEPLPLDIVELVEAQGYEEILLEEYERISAMLAGSESVEKQQAEEVVYYRLESDEVLMFTTRAHPAWPAILIASFPKFGGDLHLSGRYAGDKQAFHTWARNTEELLAEASKEVQAQLKKRLELQGGEKTEDSP